MDISKLKKINGFNDYYIDENCNVYSIKINKLKPTNTTDGYLQYHFSENGIHKYPRAHRIIAETFIENKYNLPVVNHIDGNKKNNNISNLEWVTFSENSLHSVHMLGNKPPITNAKSVKSINETNSEVIEFSSISECARFYKVKYSTISAKLTNKNNNPSKQGRLKNIKFELYDEESPTTIESK